MKPYSLIAVIFNLALAVALSSCTAEDNSPGGGGGGGVDTTLAGETYIDDFTAKLTTSKIAINTSWVAKPAPDGWTVTRYTIILTDADGKRTTTTVPVGTGANYSRDITAKIGTYRVAIVAYVSDATGTETATSSVTADKVEIPDQTEAPASPPAPTVTASNYDGQGHLIVTWEAPTDTGKYSNGTVASITNYILYWKKGGAPSRTDYDGTETVSDTNYTIGNLNTGTYHVAVVSVNSANRESALSEVTSTAVTIILGFRMEEISSGDTTLTVTSEKDISSVVANNDALLAGITVNRALSGEARGTDNLATGVTLTGNSLVITIDPAVEPGDEWFVDLVAGLVEDAAGNPNTAVALSSRISLTDRFSVANLPRSTATLGGTSFVPDNYRSYFVTFSIGTSTAEEGEYRLGIKQASASKPTPTVTELTNASAAITRTLSSKQINIYLPFHIEGTYFDTGVTQDYTTARATLLSPATKYSLYLTPADGSGSVEKVLDFTTDAVPATVPGPAFYGLPIPFSHKYTVRTNEPFMLITEFGTLPTGPVLFSLYNNPSNDPTIFQCYNTCSLNPNFPSYKGWISKPVKTYIFVYVIKEESLGISFNDGNTIANDDGNTRIDVYLIFQTVP